jgi:hypothetical protein
LVVNVAGLPNAVSLQTVSVNDIPAGSGFTVTEKSAKFPMQKFGVGPVGVILYRITAGVVPVFVKISLMGVLPLVVTPLTDPLSTVLFHAYVELATLIAGVKVVVPLLQIV